MVYLYRGTPGSGKSLHQAYSIYWRLRAGKPVIANFDINTSAIKKSKGDFLYLPNDKLTPRKLVNYSREYFAKHRFHEGALQLYVDECQLLFNSRDWAQFDRKEWLMFFTQHRKYGYDIFLVAQYDRMLDKQLRSLIEYEVKHRKVSNFGIKGKIFSLCAGGNLFVSVKIWYPLREKVGSEFFKFRKRYAQIYDSYKDFTDAPAPSKPAKPAPDKESSETSVAVPAPSFWRRLLNKIFILFNNMLSPSPEALKMLGPYL